tara:strand:+ start:889 stop:1980 length:1092 start_codon:yes stop_codon:yes gene_type:complete
MNDNKKISIAEPDLRGNEYKYLKDAFKSSWISSIGKYIDLFENNFSSFCNSRYGVSVSNGTVALDLALNVLGIGESDEVIVPDLTFAATINAVLHQNAKPIIVDIEENSWCIDPVEIKKAITPNTKAIIPVHLYGQVCNMDEILKIADEYGLYVIEDCAESHGASWKGKKVGSFGDIGCFSFYGNKIMTTGEGGMCITNSNNFNEKMRILRDHGMSKKNKYFHEYIGYNYRMTNLQASIGVAQLERIKSILDERQKIEDLYKKYLKNNKNIIFQKNKLPYRSKTVWFVSVLLKEKRDYYIEKLNKLGIDTRPFFIPLSEMSIYEEYVSGETKVSKKISKMGINLPTNFMVDEECVSRIAEVLY